MYERKQLLSQIKKLAQKHGAASGVEMSRRDSDRHFRVYHIGFGSQAPARAFMAEVKAVYDANTVGVHLPAHMSVVTLTISLFNTF